MFEIANRKYYIDTDDQEVIELAKSLAKEDPESFPDGFQFRSSNIIEIFELDI